ncbi:MAG: ParB/RepB/Spo0J family partition protein [Candidatus Izimaplasma sp.]|nr:ParB/RepB/Spo0J family partition protein [Candidatus Izimaplasma bacterium]
MSETRLGRKFSDLMAENKIEFKDNEEILEIELHLIKPNPDQPRTFFDEKKLIELANSIKEHGIFQPVILKPSGHGYTLVAGERRVKAAKMAGLYKIPAIIRDYNSRYLIELAILENLQREDLTPMEEAIAFQKAIFNLKYTHEELGKKIGKSRVYVTNIIGLLNLPASVINDVNLGTITMGHARSLSKLKDQKLIISLRDRIIKESLTVRDIERIIRGLSKEKDHPIVSNDDLQKAEKKLFNKIDSGINYRFRKNNITFTFSSPEELERLIEFLIREE